MPLHSIPSPFHTRYLMDALVPHRHSPMKHKHWHMTAVASSSKWITIKMVIELHLFYYYYYLSAFGIPFLRHEYVAAILLFMFSSPRKEMGHPLVKLPPDMDQTSINVCVRIFWMRWRTGVEDGGAGLNTKNLLQMYFQLSNNWMVSLWSNICQTQGRIGGGGGEGWEEEQWAVCTTQLALQLQSNLVRRLKCFSFCFGWV